MDKFLLQELKKLSILCVEDEDGIRKRLVNTLKYYFSEVYEANSGHEGLKSYFLNKPDIVLSDIIMENKDGVKLVQDIRKKDKDTAIIILSASSKEEYLLGLINCNIDYYILKPLNLEKLGLALEKVLFEKMQKILDLGNEVFLNLHTREILHKNKNILLRKREVEFLKLLYEDKKYYAITTYEKIETRLWEDKHMSANALKTFIRDLRKRLPIEILINVLQEGYRLKK